MHHSPVAFSFELLPTIIWSDSVTKVKLPTVQQIPQSAPRSLLMFRNATVHTISSGQ